MNAETSEVSELSEARRTEAVHWRIVLVIGIVARVFFCFQSFKFTAGLPLTARGFENIAIAISILGGHGYASPFFSNSGPTAFMAPVYPLFLAGIMSVFGTGVAATMAVIALQEVASVLTVLVVTIAARLHFGIPTANIAGLVCAVAPSMLMAPLMVYDTMFSAFFLVSFLAAASSMLLARARFIPAGVACAIAGLMNPALIPTLWAICGWTAWKAKVLPWAGVLTFFLVFSPWPVRNMLAMHAFVPLRSSFGYELWMGNHPGGNGSFDQSLNPMVTLAERQDFVNKGELVYMKERGDLAKAYIAAAPGRFLWLDVKRVAQFWSGSEGGAEFTTVPLFALAITGLVLLAKRRGPVLLYALPLILFPLPYYITHADFRFHFVLDPVLLILAGHAIVVLLKLGPLGAAEHR